jgi:RNA polymerase sigma factor (sigma-70 family)
MATSQTSGVIQHLRRTVLLREGAGLTDGQLLGCFIEHRDDAAFAALVRRHGPMVWGVCRRLLNQHDAEDAFQATFLVLVRKAVSVVPRERVANWLYGVAHQTALQARRTAARRRAREKQVTEMPEPAVAEPDLWLDLQPLLDQGLSRLPDKYRVVIVLCDLEGKTRKEVAEQFGLPEGTVGSRLARARAMLAKRLARRGLTVPGAALAAVLSEDVASAGVPTSVLSSTLNAASVFAAGRAAATGAISPTVAALTEGVLKAMLVSKLKLGVAVLAVVGALGLGVAGVRAMQAADPPVAGNGPQPVEVKPVEVKPVGVKPVEVKPVEVKPGEAENPKQPPQARDKGLRETLLGLEKAGWEALKGKKRRAAAAALADDFVAVLADGGRLNRAGFLKLLADLTVTDYSLSDVALTRLTPDAAVLTYQVRTDYTYKGEAAKETVRVSSAWARRDGRWVNVLYHETRVKK